MNINIKNLNQTVPESKIDSALELKNEEKSKITQNPFLIKSNNNFEITFGNNFNIKSGIEFTQNNEHSYSFHSELKYLDADKNVNMTETSLLSDILSNSALKSQGPSKKKIISKSKI